jgi:hypothetical protein
MNYPRSFLLFLISGSCTLFINLADGVKLQIFYQVVGRVSTDFATVVWIKYLLLALFLIAANLSILLDNLDSYFLRLKPFGLSSDVFYKVGKLGS